MKPFPCPRCGLFNPPDVHACGRCGQPFTVAGGAPGGAWVPPGAWAPQHPVLNPPPAAKGRSTGAIVAIVIAVVFVVGVPVVGIVAAIVIPSLIRARIAANESSAIGTLRMIGSAEATYRSRNRRFATLAELTRANLIDASITNGATRHGYVFREVRISETAFEFCAEPTNDATSGDNSYNITETFMIRSREGPVAPVGASGKPIG